MKDMRESLIEFILRHGEFSDDVFTEDVPFEGNCSAIDAETDKQSEDWIRQELASGNLCAWCCYAVTAKLCGYKESVYLGGCSYKSFQDLHDCEFETQKTEAAYQLADRLLADYARIGQILDAVKHGLTLERLFSQAK